MSGGYFSPCYACYGKSSQSLSNQTLKKYYRYGKLKTDSKEKALGHLLSEYPELRQRRLLKGVIQNDELLKWNRSLPRVLREILYYFKRKNELCLITSTGRYNPHSPIEDLIIVNLSQGYFMIVETEPHELNFNAAKKYVRDIFDGVFDEEIKNGIEWKWIGFCLYKEKHFQEIDLCRHCFVCQRSNMCQLCQNCTDRCCYICPDYPSCQKKNEHFIKWQKEIYRFDETKCDSCRKCDSHKSCERCSDIISTFVHVEDENEFENDSDIVDKLDKIHEILIHQRGPNAWNPSIHRLEFLKIACEVLYRIHQKRLPILPSSSSPYCKMCDWKGESFIGIKDIELITSEVLLGNGLKTSSVQEAKDILWSRDYKDIKVALRNFRNGFRNFGLKCVPELFFPSFPKNLGKDSDEVRSHLLSKANLYNSFQIKTRLDRSRGDNAEEKVFKFLKEYFMNQDAVLIHSHVFKDGQEKDFIIVNLTKGYIMTFEVKNYFNRQSDQLRKACKQLHNAKRNISFLLSRVFKEEMNWSYFGLIVFLNGDRYLLDEEVQLNCGCRDFVCVGLKDLKIALDRIHGCRTNDWQASDHLGEFALICQELFYESQGDKGAPTCPTKMLNKLSLSMDKASVPENIFFWSPDQLSIKNAMNERFMVLMSYYGCGKTILLKERAFQLLGNKSRTKGRILFYIMTTEE